MKRIPKRTILLVAFFGAFAVPFVVYKAFLIQSIVLQGADSLIGVDQISKRPLFLIDQSADSQSLLRSNPMYENIQITKHYPNKLSIVATRSKSIAFVKVSDGYYEISQTGKIVAKVRKYEKKLPLIVLQQLLPYESYAVGQVISIHEVVFSAYILDSFMQHTIPIETVEMQGFDVVLCKGAGRTYIFSASKDKVVQVSDVAAIYRQFFIEGKKFSKIDVRFDKPIIVFE